MTGYPELDALTPMLTALQARTDFRSHEWHEAAEAVGQAFDAIAATRDELATWLAEVKQWLDANADHERHAEVLKLFLIKQQQHRTYQRQLDYAADVIVGVGAAPDEAPEPESVTQLPMDERTKARTTLTERVRQRRTTAA